MTANVSEGVSKPREKLTKVDLVDHPSIMWKHRNRWAANPVNLLYRSRLRQVHKSGMPWCSLSFSLALIVLVNLLRSCVFEAIL